MKKLILIFSLLLGGCGDVVNTFITTEPVTVTAYDGEKRYLTVVTAQGIVIKSYIPKRNESVYSSIGDKMTVNVLHTVYDDNKIYVEIYNAGDMIIQMKGNK